MISYIIHRYFFLSTSYISRYKYARTRSFRGIIKIYNSNSSLILPLLSSPRRIITVKNYYIIAVKFMSENDSLIINRLCFILPLINTFLLKALESHDIFQRNGFISH